MLEIAKWAVKRFQRLTWFIEMDETHQAFFGNRKKLNEKLKELGIGEYVFGYRADTSGATGSFRFIVVSICCKHIRIPIAIKIVAINGNYREWLEDKLRLALSIVPKGIILADRGFGKATWFHQIIERTNADFIIRIPVRKKETKNKITRGTKRFQQWIKDRKTNEKVLLDIVVAKDEQEREYIFATNRKEKGKNLVAIYMKRWNIENQFKDSDRVELPTSSRNPVMRLFCITLSLLLFALWQTEKLVIPKISVRTFVKRVIHVLSKALGYIITITGRVQKTGIT